MRTLLSSKSGFVMASLVLGSALTLFGCAADGTDTEDTTAQDSSANEEIIGTAEQAITSGWTAYTSEEYAPIVCDNGSLMNAVQFTGSKSDNVRAYCQPTGGSAGASSWTSYFSEEGTNYRFCPSGQWVTGIACSGSYCDNVSLQCTTIYGIAARSCYWTGWMSEENGGYLGFGSNYYMRGAQCSGNNCDNMRFYVCQK